MATLKSAWTMHPATVRNRFFDHIDAEDRARLFQRQPQPAGKLPRRAGAGPAAAGWRG